MGILRELWNNDAFIVGTAIFLVGLGFGIFGLIERRRRKVKTAKTV